MSAKPVTIALVVAAAENGVIGRDGKIPWRVPSDLRLFRRLTLGKPVIMGRKTYESIGKPLDGRDNIVVTRDDAFAQDGIVVCHSADEALTRAVALAEARGAEEVVVIGGAEIYRALMPRASRVYLTRVHASPDGTTFFDTPDATVWRESSREKLQPDPRDEHDASLIVFDRVV